MGGTLDDKARAVGNSDAEKVRAELSKGDELHRKLDALLLAALAVLALSVGDIRAFLKSFVRRMKQFPNIYTPQFDWKRQQMNKFVALALGTVGVHSIIKTYVVEKAVVRRAHKKYKAHKTNWAVILHGSGSSLEVPIGALACCYPQRTILTKISATLAINNVVTGFVLTPGVFGIKHMTVPGFALFGALRALEIFRTLYDDYRNYPQAWILLQVGTVVRHLGWYVLPYSSTDGIRGDLFTEPTMYTFNILLSGYLTAAFVYPPKLVLASLAAYMYWYTKQPPRISRKRITHHEDANVCTGYQKD